MTVAAFIDRSHKDKEGWKYTNLDKLLTNFSGKAPSNSNFLTQDKEAPRLLFINGIFQPHLSHFATLPSCILMGDLKAGYELTLGEKTCLVTQPIELVFTSDDKAPSEIAIRLAVDIGKNGRLTFLENHQASQMTTLEMDITLHKSAKFVHGKIVRGGPHLAMTKVYVAQGGYYNNFSLLGHAPLIRNEIAVQLQGEEAQAALNGAMLINTNEHIDTTTHITHEAPNCMSRQIYKTVLDGKAHGVFQGNIKVMKDAQKSDGYQLSRALLLSDQAEMDAKPALEIYADDVKCSHGSTVGDLDDNALFYLRSRGLSEKEARALLINGFIIEMLDEIQIEGWRKIFSDEIDRWAQ